MAKRKRRSRLQQNSSTNAALPESSAAVEAQDDPSAKQDAATRFLGQWNRLVSTTNWEKGRIICDWRDALMADGAAVTEYSDEAWAQLVGGVTSQHVGRLRRVFQQFGETYDQYEGLYWSHFQAALDWDDAEMWLEGAIQNQWSVSQMRGKRWETLGTPSEEQRTEVAQDVFEIDTSEIDEGLLADKDSNLAENNAIDGPASAAASTAEIKPVEGSSGKTDGKQAKNESNEEDGAVNQAPSDSPVSRRKQLGVDVENLPDDLAEAFETFKLAIIAHRRENWNETPPETVLGCLDALKELVLADGE